MNAEIARRAAAAGASTGPPTGDRAQHSTAARRRWRRGVVVGEDVVEFVAPPAALEPAHIRALAVAVGERGLGVLAHRLGLLVIVVFVGLLGQAEVHQRAMPAV